MKKSAAMILKGVVMATFLISSISSISSLSAQLISLNTPKLKDLKSSKSTFKVVFVEDEKTPLNFNVKVNNPTHNPIKVYLRSRAGFNFLEEKSIDNNSHATMQLDLAPLEDGDYTFVIKNNDHFFIKHIILKSGDLVTSVVNGKPTMNIERSIQFSEE
jgi:hypothetical protein